MTASKARHDNNHRFRLIHSALSAYDRSGRGSDFNGLKASLWSEIKND